MKIKLSIAAVLAIVSISAQAELTCSDNANNCSVVSPNLGDTQQSADNSVSESNQNNPSSNSNQSGNSLSGTNKNANNNDGSITGGNVTGGNTSSHGGSATGNRSDNDNDSQAHASNGNQSFNAGTTSNKLGQSSNNDLANNNHTSNDVANRNDMANNQGQSSSNANDLANSNKVGQGQSLDSNNKLTGGNQGQGQSSANKNNNSLGQSLASSNNVGSSNKVNGSKQGQSSRNDLSTSDNRTQSTTQGLANSGNSASGSNSSNSMGRSGNSVTQVDASNNSSYSALSYRIPEINPVSSITLANGSSNTVVTPCNVYSGVRSKGVYGTYVGLTKKVDLYQGEDDTLVRAVDQNGKPVHFLTETAADGSTLRIGSQNIITTSIISLGGSRSLNLGGGFGAGEYGQAGGANSSQAQRVVTNIQTVNCVFDITPPPVVAPKVVEKEVIKYVPLQDLPYLRDGQAG